MTDAPFAKIPMNIEFTKKSRRGALVIQYGAISYYKILGLPFPYDELMHLRPDTVRYVEIAGDLPVNPHIDHTTICALNCYFESGGCTTHFWEPTSSTVPTKFPGADTANLYKNTDLKHIGSFKAEDGEAYLLNVSRIHSVDRPDRSVPRRFVQLSWRHTPFSEVLLRIEQCKWGKLTELGTQKH